MEGPGPRLLPHRPGQPSRVPGHNWRRRLVGPYWDPLGVVRRFAGTRQLHRRQGRRVHVSV